MKRVEALQISRKYKALDRDIKILLESTFDDLKDKLGKASESEVAELTENIADELKSTLAQKWTQYFMSLGYPISIEYRLHILGKEFFIDVEPRDITSMRDVEEAVKNASDAEDIIDTEYDIADDNINIMHTNLIKYFLENPIALDTQNNEQITEYINNFIVAYKNFCAEKDIKFEFDEHDLQGKLVESMINEPDKFKRGVLNCIKDVMHSAQSYMRFSTAELSAIDNAIAVVEEQNNMSKGLNDNLKNMNKQIDDMIKGYVDYYKKHGTDAVPDKKTKSKVGQFLIVAVKTMLPLILFAAAVVAVVMLEDTLKTISIGSKKIEPSAIILCLFGSMLGVESGIMNEFGAKSDAFNSRFKDANLSDALKKIDSNKEKVSASMTMEEKKGECIDGITEWQKCYEKTGELTNMIEKQIMEQTSVVI